MELIDISEPISPETAVFPGDTPYSNEQVMRIADGGSCNVSTMRMSVHCATHTDAPLHFENEGRDMASVDLAPYCGPCRVIAVDGEGDPRLVPPSALTEPALRGAERVLFKTSAEHDHTTFDPRFCALGPAAAEALAAAGVVLVGIDTPSMDHATSKELAAHHVLYRAGIAILENLDLSQVDPGDYELIALPLRIVGADSSPVRAVLRR